MSLNRDDVKRLARLARIEVKEADEETLVSELNAVMAWEERLQKIDVSGVDLYVASESLRERPDCVTEANLGEAILENAPMSCHGMFAVPKVLE